MDNNSLSIIIPVIVALIAAIPGIIAVVAQRKKDKIEVEATAAEKLVATSANINQSYKDLLDEFKTSADHCRSKLEQMELQIEDQEKLIRELIAENQKLKELVAGTSQVVEELKIGIQLLVDQIEKLGHKPAYKPKGEQ